MKNLILGGSGFIGSHICDAVGGDVVVYDKIQHPYYLSYTEGLESLIRESDIVYNFAGALGTSSSFGYMEETVKTNTMLAVSVMDNCLKYKRPLINIGVPLSMWKNPYAISKHCMMSFAEMYYDEGMMGYTLIAYNVYGERQIFSQTEKLVPAVVHRILHHEPIKIYGAGKQEIDMVYVKDVAKLVAMIGANICSFNGKEIHAGTGEAVTVMEVINTICDIMGVPEEERNFQFMGRRRGEGEKVCVVSPSSITTSVTLREGLEKTVEWYREYDEYAGKVEYGGRPDIIGPWAR